ncbi:MAG: hypothetical protein CMH49_03455 [Myxococcales bacterium]|nr:hypothetical protein [Myxococcales bacterium]
MLSANGYPWILKLVAITISVYLASRLFQEFKPSAAQPYLDQDHSDGMLVTKKLLGNDKIEHKMIQSSSLSSRVISALDLIDYFKRDESENDTVTPTLDEQVLLFDARNLYPQYYWSHVQGAQHSPWRNFTKAWRSGVLVDLPLLTKKVQFLGIRPEKSVIIYGDWEQGWGEEARLLWLLEYLGHQKVYVVEGGWEAIKAAKVPISWGKSRSVEFSNWRPIPQEHLRADSKKVELFLSQAVLSIDARSLREYQGATPYGSAYGGHLPQSVQLDMKDLLDTEQRLKSKSELQKLFHSLGVKLDQPVFTYCTGGIRSAFIYLALREAGFNQAMNYDGSWWEWTKNHPLKQP